MRPRRLPPKTFQTLAVELLADPHEFAAPLAPPTGPDDWIYRGTVTIDGTTGALAWRRDGSFGVGVGDTVRVLGVWEGIAIACALGKADPGRRLVPSWPAPLTWGSTWGGWPS